MKKDIHPEYMECTVRCSCGNEFTTRSTKPELRIDICNVCHPFYSGTQKLIDTGGRVQRFADRFGSATETVAAREAAKKAERAAKVAEQEAAKKAAREAKAAEKAARKAKFEEEAAAAGTNDVEVAADELAADATAEQGSAAEPSAEAQEEAVEAAE